MNVPLLKKVRAQILQAPEHFRMDVFTCGTAHCIAGWAYLLHRKLKRITESRHYELILEHAGPILKIDDSQAERLFYLDEWPTRFSTDYRGAENQRDRARIAAKRIDHFIATCGAE